MIKPGFSGFRFGLFVLTALILALALASCSSRPSRDASRMTLQLPIRDPTLKVGTAEAPDARIKEDIAFLEEATKKLLEGCIIKASDGTPLYTPDGKAHYAALWTRDFASMVENAGDLMPKENIEKCIDYLIKGIREDGAVPDRVQVDGHPVYAAGAPEIPLGEPNIDNAQFLVFAVTSYLDMVRTDRQKFLYRKWSSQLQKGMHYIPLAESGLVWNNPAKPHSPYGFTDTVAKTGELFMESLLINSLWDDKTGMFFAASRDCRQTDIWANAYAVYIGFPLGDKKDRIIDWLVNNFDRYVWKGQVRHLPKGEYWERQLMPVEKERYQNGAYWATPAGWVMRALNERDPTLARRMFRDLVEDFRLSGICECINVDYRQLASYVNSATNPLAAARWVFSSRVY